MGGKMTNLQFSPEMLDRGALLKALRALRKGEFSVRMPMDLVGIDGEIAQAFNDVVEINEMIAGEFARIGNEVGKEGKTGQRAKLPVATGSWQECVESVNTLIGDLVQPTAEVARVIESVAKGDLSQSMLLEIDGRPLRGDFLRIGKVVNTMVNQLGGFASEVSRVAREVGTEGKLGGQAQVPGVAGTGEVAQGVLLKIDGGPVRGEFLRIGKVVNTMVNQLGGFAAEVSRVAREVGTEGKLGGQAQVLGVAGTWKDLTDNVNQLAANLTGQVRNIAEVTTAVAKGDLSKKITVDVKGEILELKSTNNTMTDQHNAYSRN